MSILRSPRPSSAIATAPLLAVVIALALAAAPLFPRIAPWVIGLFFVACTARLLMNRPSARLPSLPLKVLLFALGISGVSLTYGTFLGIEAGLSILLFLVSLKLLETNNVRDFLVITLLGFFLALCDLFFTQSLPVWAYVAGIFVLLTATLIRFHRGLGVRSFRGSARTALVLLLQALPIIVLLFIFFPRSSRYQFLMQFSQPIMGGGGMSDSLSPGSFAAIALGKEPVFIASFPGGPAPSMNLMYWRGTVLWSGDGLTWVRGRQMSPESRLGQPAGPVIRQKITLQPHGARWLYALDRPVSEGLDGRFEIESGGSLKSKRTIFKRLTYEVRSRPENRETSLPGDQRTETLRLPTRVSPQALALVEGWRAKHPADRELVEAALRHFRTERFTYTLDPGTYEDPDPLHEFLFQRRAGFCEHYAAAFATLMRLAGIPSRVILGYHGGEWNDRGKYVTVRQSEAHAWCEVWIKGEGWQRIDPTEVIAPDRLTSGLETYLETRAASDPAAVPPSAAATGLREIRRELRLAWDNLNYQWDLRVLSFDEDSQRALLNTHGLGNLQWVDLLLGVAFVIALLLGLLGLWLRRPVRPPLDRSGRAYARFCRTLAAAGLPREPWEGPQHFGERAARHFSAHEAALREITTLYTNLRYAPAPPSPDAFLRALRRLPPLARAPRK